MEVLSRLPQIVLASLRDSGWVWLAAALGLVAVTAGVARWRRSAPQRRLRRTIQRLGPRVLSDVTIPDAVAGRLHLEHLVLTTRDVLVVDIKDYRGMLFGGETTDFWTQVVDGRSFKFDNPLRENAARVHAVQALAGDIPVQGVVVFTDAGEFPRQRPTGVYMLSSLLSERDPAPLHTPVPLPLQEGWRQITSTVR